MYQDVYAYKRVIWFCFPQEDIITTETTMAASSHSVTQRMCSGNSLVVEIHLQISSVSWSSHPFEDKAVGYSQMHPGGTSFILEWSKKYISERQTQTERERGGKGQERWCRGERVDGKRLKIGELKRWKYPSVNFELLLNSLCALHIWYPVEL